MQYSTAILCALATAASAMKNNTSSTVSYTTVTVDTYTTVCPVSQAITYGDKTYTNTETVESTITLPCPCTMVTPVYVTSSVLCTSCPASSVPATSVPATSAPAVPSYPSKNSSAPVVPGASKTTAPGSVGTQPSVPAKTQLTAGASGNTVALASVSIAGLLAIAAYIL